ncbi:MAG: FAD-dependent oxidoreductase, partial [Gammaproteobacteria bacterium]
MKQQQIVLIGAGLAGCLLAVYLAKRGYRVRLFEKRPDMRVHPIPAGRSINLSLSVRGIHALREVGLYERIEPELIAMPGRMLHEHSGSLHFQPYGKKPGDRHYSVSRGTLNKLLLNAAEECGVDILFNRECLDLDPLAKTITLKDLVRGFSYSLKYDVAIGTDGAGSAVGRALSTGEWIDSTHERLAHGYKELTIPASEDGGYRLEKNALHIWPRGGFMLIALPNTDGSFTATLFLPQTGPSSFESLTSEESVQQFVERSGGAVHDGGARRPRRLVHARRG